MGNGLLYPGMIQDGHSPLSSRKGDGALKANRIHTRMQSGAGRLSPEAGATHPALPAVVLLVSFAVFMAAIAPLDFSGVIAKIFPFHPVQLQKPNAVVWVSQSAGVYFCADSVMFGKSEGKLMKQAQALDSGYQPALGSFCSGPDWPLPPQYRRPDGSPMPANPLAAPPSELPGQVRKGAGKSAGLQRGSTPTGVSH